MSDIPKPTAADAYENTEALLCEMQGLRDQLAEVKWDRDNLQDQRDFAMREIELLRTEYFETLDSAWGLIANAGGGNWDLQTEQWRQAARRWRDKYLSTTASKKEKEGVK